MSTLTYNYPLPHGDPDLGAEADVTFHYTFSPGCRARIQFDELDHPGEADEIELARVDVVGETRPYRKNDNAEWIEDEATQRFADDGDLRATLIEYAREELARGNEP